MRNKNIRDQAGLTGSAQISYAMTAIVILTLGAAIVFCLVRIGSEPRHDR